MNKDVYRKVSLERLSSPEQLDTLMRVTSPRGWLALAALGLLLLSAIAWGIGGTISTKMETQGVFIRPGGLQTIYAGASGTITDIRVVENDEVTKGDVVARVEQPALLEKLGQLNQSLKAAQGEYGQQPNKALAGQIDAVQAAIAAAKSNYMAASRIVSPYTGRVLEVRSKAGSAIGSGMPLLTVESGAKQAGALEAVMYLPVQQGKTIVPGMAANIYPSSVNREEYGFIRGRVTTVSEYPVTAQAMMATIGSEALVAELAGRGAALLEVRIAPLLDPGTASGYKWSTTDGPPVRIDSGTPVTASIIIKTQKPITSIIPQIK